MKRNQTKKVKDLRKERHPKCQRSIRKSKEQYYNNICKDTGFRTGKTKSSKICPNLEGDFSLKLVW